LTFHRSAIPRGSAREIPLLNLRTIEQAMN